MDAKPSRAAIYTRISNDAAGDEHGVTNQTTVAAQLAAARGWEVVRAYSDNDISATNGKYRPDYHEMMAAADRREFDAIVIFHSSRLWRNRRERADGIEILRKAGVSVVAVKGPSLDMSTAYGRGMAGLVGEFDTMESEVKSERQQLAAQQRAENGKPPLGTRLTGYTSRGTLVPDEAAVVAQMFERFHSGESLRAIAAWLGTSGVPTWRMTRAQEAARLAEAALADAVAAARHAGRQADGEERAKALSDEIAVRTARMEQARERLGAVAGRPWNPSSVQGILANPRYAGRAIYRGEANGAAGQWEAIVPEWLFDSVNATLADPRRRKQVGTDRKHLGSGLYVCGVCQRPVRAHTGTIAGRPTQHRYRCAEGHLTRKSEPIDRVVIAAIRLRLAKPDLAQLLVAPDSAQARAAAEEIRRQRGRLVQVEADYDADLIDARRYKIKRDKIQAELAAAEAAQLRLVAPSSVAGTIGAADPVAAFDGAPLGMRREVIKFFVVVRLLPAPRGRHFDPYSVQFDWLQ